MKAFIFRSTILAAFAVIILVLSPISAFAATSDTLQQDNHRSLISFFKDKEEITTAEALKIAYNHAGVDKQDVLFPSVEVHISDNQKNYKIQFFVGLQSYTYLVDAATGKIITFEIINYAETAA